MTVFGLILMRYFLHYGPISVKKCCVIFCIMRYAIFSLRYTFFKAIMQRTNTGVVVVVGHDFFGVVGVVWVSFESVVDHSAKKVCVRAV